MNNSHQLLRLVAELLLGWMLAFGLAFATMLVMFRFGPWANPPGIDILHWVLKVLFTIVCLFRAYRRWAVGRSHLESATYDH